MRRRMLALKARSRAWLGREQGMSLVEIIIIMVILGISLLPISRLSISNAYFGGRYVTMMRSVYYAQEVMEHIIADYNSDDGTIGGYSNVRTNWPGTVSGSPIGLTGSVTISGEQTRSGIKYVTVLVRVSGTDIPDIDLTTLLVDNS